MKMKLMALLSISCIISLLCGCTDTKAAKDAQRKQAEIEECNTMSQEVRVAVEEVRQLSDEHSVAFLDLYLFDIVDDKLDTLFYRGTAETPMDSEGEYVVTQNFIDEVRQNNVTDTYGIYLTNYADKKQVDVTELKEEIYNWNMLSKTEQDAVFDTNADYSDFALNNAVVIKHEYYVRMGTDVVSEVYCFAGELGQQLSVIVLWQDGKIHNVTRMWHI